MAYQPHFIANFQSGLEKDLEPWLIPDDAFSVLYDCYIRHGVINKRDGYNYYATGLKGDAPYCESRIVRATSATLTGTVDGVNQDFTATLTTPVRRGGITVSDTSVGQTLTDDGTGSLTGDGTGTINYTTGALAVTFSAAPTSGTPTVVYQYHPGLPVMMIANFTTATNAKELIVADTDFLNKYNITTNRLDDITNRIYTGAKNNFFDWTNYPTTDDEPRLIFTNNVDPIQSYDGTNVADFVPVCETTDVTGEAYALGTGGMGPYLHTASNTPIFPGSVVISEAVSGQTVTDDGAGGLTGDGTGTVDYDTGDISVTFTANIALNDPILLAYSWESCQVLTCLHVFHFKDRLILLRTTETGGTIYPQRIRISGTGQSGDDFRIIATGAGVIDIPDQEWITGAAFNRDDLVIFTIRSTWILKYTGNDIVPFTLDKIDDSRGNLAPFAPISYLNLTKGYSPYGMVVTDGYQLQRNDDKIPDYSYEQIDPANFDLCFSGNVDDDDHHYLIHPSADQMDSSDAISDRILVQNYQEGNFSVYRIPLSCMGQYFESFDITWNDLLTLYPDSGGTVEGLWDQFAADFATWNDISYSKDQPISLGGGHKGEIWRLNLNEGEDNPVKIRNITSISETPTLTVEVTSDWNNYTAGNGDTQNADYIYFTGIEGATELNGKMGYVSTVTDNHTFRVTFPGEDPASITAYTQGGTVSRVIPVEMDTKNFNPFTQQSSKVRCGWIYLRTDTTSTLLEDQDGNVVPAEMEVEVYTNDNTQYHTQIRSTALIPQGDMSNRSANGLSRVASKRWTKVFINQTGDFVQFKLKNTQPGARVRIHALNVGMMPTGRTI